MNERIERARYLGEQLTAAMDALGVATSGPDVVVFLDRLARLEAYPPAELAEVPGLAELVAEAQSARAEHRDELGKVAGYTFDLDRLLHDGRHLPIGDDGGERDGWLRDVLILATVTPWLSPARRRQAQWALEKANAMVEAEAEAFLDASVLVSDRRTLEAPAGLGEEARAFLEILGDLPLAVCFQRAPSRPDTRRVKAALEHVAPAWIDAADDALADHVGRGEIRLPGPGEPLALAAANTASAVLLRMEAGAWVVSKWGGDLRLSFEGDERDIGVEVVGGATPGVLAPESGWTFLLPRTPRALDLRLRVGPDSRLLRIEPAEHAEPEEDFEPEED